MNASRSEDIEIRRKRLRFRSNHRGLKEMDLLLGSFSDRYMDEFDHDQLDAYEALLEENDPDVWGWITGSPAPDELETPVLRLIRDFKFYERNK